MIERVVRLALENRGLVLIGTAFLVAAGLWAGSVLTLDAVPDVTNNQVQIITPVPGTSPVEVEKLVTVPLESALSGLPNVIRVRSISKFALSQVTVVFEDSVDVYFARQLVAEQLQAVKDELPSQMGLNPAMGPVTTGLGEVFQYTLQRDPSVPICDQIRDVQRRLPGYDAARPDDPATLGRAELMALRSCQDWIVRPMLRGIAGVADINAFGGFNRQYQVVVDPHRLQAYGLSIDDLQTALKKNNTNAGGAYIERAGEYALVRGVGALTSLEDIGNVVLKAEHGTPVYVKDVGEVLFEGEVRLGGATANGKGEAVLGTVMMLKGSNARTTVAAVKQRLPAVRKALPPGVILVPFYDRQALVEQTVRTACRNLLHGCLLVIIVLYLLLGNLRGSLIVALVIPLSMLFALICMVKLGISGNLMSLGAIDFGVLIDGAVVLVENVLRLLHHHYPDTLHEGGDLGRQQTVVEAAAEVARPVAFGVIIILIVYLPIITLQQMEGKLFRPLAYTVVFALLGCLLAALTIVPALGSFFLKATAPHRQRPNDGCDPNPADEDTWLTAFFRRLYGPTLEAVLRRPAPAIGTALVLLLVSLAIFPTLGSVFIPKLDEGPVVVEVFMIPATSLTHSMRMQTVLEGVVGSFPEVASVVGKMGSAEIATDPDGPDSGDLLVTLKPQSQWPTKRSKQELLDAIGKKLAEVPGVVTSFTQPIELRVNDLVAGVKADVAVKVFGADFGVLDQLTERIESVLKGVRGVSDILTEQTNGLPVVNITLDRGALARYGLNVADAQELVEIGIGGGKAGDIMEGDARYDLVVRLKPSARQDIQEIGALVLRSPAGELVPLRDVAHLEWVEGPAQISRESASRVKTVSFNARGRDIGSLVAEAQAKIDREVRLPTGYHLDWGGQFENLRRARQRLYIVVPLALALIFALLFLMFGSLPQTLLIFANVPMAVSGGIYALWLRGLPFSISAGVGFIVLAGIAVLNGVVMIAYFNNLRDRGLSTEEVVRRGAMVRLRPILMTALCDMVGFIPMAISTTQGAEVQRPLATVVIGGLVTATMLTLLVLPALYRATEDRSD